MGYAPRDESTCLLRSLVSGEVAILQINLIDHIRVDAESQCQITLVGLMGSKRILLAREMDLELALLLEDDPLDAPLDNPAKVQD